MISEADVVERRAEQEEMQRGMDFAQTQAGDEKVVVEVETVGCSSGQGAESQLHLFVVALSIEPDHVVDSSHALTLTASRVETQQRVW